MKRPARILIPLLLLSAASCIKEPFSSAVSYPEGTPVTLHIGFGAVEPLDVSFGTKAEASRADESRVHDLYVLLFDQSGDVFYSRYFTYEHMNPSLPSLDGQSNEGWYVENLQINESSAERKTRGVVKISTESKQNCTLVLIANVSNTITRLDDMPAVEKLAGIESLAQLQNVRVTLSQEVVNRNDLFLMIGVSNGVDTGDLHWGRWDAGSSTGDYETDPSSGDYQVRLKALDAKVKFRIRVDRDNISDISPRFWRVCNVPANSYLFPRTSDTPLQDLFDTENVYFETVEKDEAGTWQVFTFYMLENRPDVSGDRIMDMDTPAYYYRESQVKNDDPDHPGKVINGDWLYAPASATYVQFDAVLTLTPAGIEDVLGAGSSIQKALTSDALFTVHLGDFTGSEDKFDDYKVWRNHAYTYDITIENSNKIYVEVRGDNLGIREDEPGQEGSLLLSTDEIINCDAHYEYHSMVFSYNAALAEEGAEKKMSWFVKTPFSKGGGRFNEELGRYEIPEGTDCLWVKFALNPQTDGVYSANRLYYPGISEEHPSYCPEWNPAGDSNEIPALIDINQLVNLLFDQNRKKAGGEASLFDSNGKICFTAFVDEFYYERDPVSGQVDPDLWRSFINATPRELHILADSQTSDDQRSDVITSSHSIIQRSIQTIYNIYAPDLSSLWGTEHLDEMRYDSENPEVKTGWPWLRIPLSVNANYCKDTENGRYNTAALWGLNPTPAEAPRWDTFLDYNVANNVPELKDDYKAMAYSCMTRNRDNDGDGRIDPEELRWYPAAINQLTGLWVGNEGLTPSARLYQPINAASTDPIEWRSHVVSSTNGKDNPRAIVAEEGTSIYEYSSNNQPWSAFGNDKSDATWNKVQSVRCVRNIGTFQSGGKTVDITQAPFDTRVDSYFEAPQGTDRDNNIRPNADGSYTIRFSNLNTRALREYTDVDLPYHDEFSIHNRVYLELNIQSPDEQIIPDGSMTGNTAYTLRGINEAITDKGYNEYCPPGYRLPNMTELSVMAALLPGSFWPGGIVNPSRTYFSKGYFCQDNLVSPPVDQADYKYQSEYQKVGWSFQKKSYEVYLNMNTQCGSIRCVRDGNRTGDITGTIVVPEGNAISPGEAFDVKLNFSSVASALQDINLSVIYLDANGNERQLLEIPTDGLRLNGLTLRETVSCTIPLDASTLGEMYIRANLRNAAGIQKEFETPIRVQSTVYSSIKLIHCDFDSDVTDPPFPVILTASSPGDPISRWRLIVTNPEKETTEIELPVLPDQYFRTYRHDYVYGTLQTGTYTFQLLLNTVGGRVSRSPSVSMEILQAGFNPNEEATVENMDNYTTASQITGTWEPQLIRNLDFLGGDFIEVNMDLTDCWYKKDTSIPDATDEVINAMTEEELDSYLTEKERNDLSNKYSGDQLLKEKRKTVKNKLTKQHNDQDIGMDNLISFGLDAIGWVDDSFHLYYPSHNTSGEDHMVFRPTFLARTVNYSTSGQKRRFDFRIDQTDMYYNNISIGPIFNDAQFTALHGRLIAAQQLYVGSIEGLHRSRATCRYVRVVHNGASSDTSYDDHDSHFGQDPVDGGNL